MIGHDIDMLVDDSKWCLPGAFIESSGCFLRPGTEVWSTAWFLLVLVPGSYDTGGHIVETLDGNRAVEYGNCEVGAPKWDAVVPSNALEIVRMIEGL